MHATSSLARLTEAPTPTEVCDRTMEICTARGLTTMHGEGSPPLDMHIRETVQGLYPRFAHATGALPLPNQRQSNRTLYMGWLQPHALPALEDDTEFRCYETLLKDGTLEPVAIPIVTACLEARRAAYDAFYETFLPRLSEAIGGVLE